MLGGAKNKLLGEGVVGITVFIPGKGWSGIIISVEDGIGVIGVIGGIIVS